METDRKRRKAPETAAEHREEAIRCLGIANSNFAESMGSADRYMKRARRHVETAELLERLGEIHR